MNPDQTAPLRSSLILVHRVCNMHKQIREMTFVVNGCKRGKNLINKYSCSKQEWYRTVLMLRLISTIVVCLWHIH